MNALLSQIPDPPKHLYRKGELPVLSLPTIAVVGTRHPDEYGKKVTKEITTQLVHAGFVIVSGFMYGVDAIAHATAMECGGKTIGVLGFGLEAPFFPPSHKLLAERMLATGNCLLSEFEPHQGARPQNFPRRNRIVAGLSLGVVVTQAAQRSGSLITARLAAEYGREVFAIPGPMDSPYCEGTKALINLGATLITSVDDIVDGLSMTLPESS